MKRQGISELITKPFDRRNIAAAIRRVMESNGGPES
jgi:DNA-binding response OmpR family regulator